MCSLPHTVIHLNQYGEDLHFPIKMVHLLANICLLTEHSCYKADSQKKKKWEKSSLFSFEFFLQFFLSHVIPLTALSEIFVALKLLNSPYRSLQVLTYQESIVHVNHKYYNNGNNKL